MQKKETITITQIAKECGVSIATVSRVLNGNVPVSPDKRIRIEEAIRKYHFTPNALARGLIRKQTMTLGVVLPDISNPYFSSMFLEIERCALDAGYSILLCNTLFGGSSHGIRNTQEEASYFKMLMDKQVDGVLVIGGQVDLTTVGASYKKALQRLQEQLPVVVIGKMIEGTGCRFIEPEDGSGVTLALNYLYQLGHRQISFIGGQRDVTITQLRLHAYRQALTALSLPPDDRLISLSDYYMEDGYSAMNTLLARQAPFSAFLAINDSVALGAQRALADRGYHVPEDAAMISCDQFFSGEFHIPRITGIQQHHEMLARNIINTLLSEIRDTPEAASFSYRPELVVRESCGTLLGVRTPRPINTRS